MSIQTTVTGDISFPDGAKVQVKESGASVYTDIGALNSAITLSLVYDENSVTTANAGDLQKQIKNMKIDGGFTLINLNYDNITKMGGGLFTTVDTAASANTTSPDQEIALGWADNTMYDLEILTSSSDSTPLRASAIPTFTAITLDLGGTPEVLAEGTEYVIQANPDSTSGYSIQFISGGMATGSPTTFAITINYASTTPIARTTMYAGSNTQTLNAIELKFTHTDDNSLIREVQLHSVDANSGGFQFNFKGANEDNTEEMPITFMGKLNSSLTDGRQLISIIKDTGAE